MSARELTFVDDSKASLLLYGYITDGIKEKQSFMNSIPEDIIHLLISFLYILDIMRDEAVFVELDEEYHQLISNIPLRINVLKIAAPYKIRSLINLIGEDLSECSMYLREMKQYVKLLDGDHIQSLCNEVIDRYRDHYLSLKKLYEKEKEDAEMREIFDGLDEYDDVERALIVQSRLESRRNRKLLLDAYKSLPMTEMSAIDIEEDLYQQRSVIQKTKLTIRMGEPNYKKVLGCLFGAILLFILLLTICLSVGEE